MYMHMYTISPFRDIAANARWPLLLEHVHMRQLLCCPCDDISKCSLIELDKDKDDKLYAHHTEVLNPIQKLL